MLFVCPRLTLDDHNWLKQFIVTMSSYSSLSTVTTTKMCLPRCISSLIPKYFKFTIAIIVFLGKASNSIDFKNDNNVSDLEPLGNITNYYDYSSHVINRYRRQTSNNGRTCKIPNNPPYTTYVVLGERETNYKPGDYANKFAILEIKCDQGYKLEPFVSPNSNCLNGKWTPSPTACIRSCPSLMSSTTTTVKCKYNSIPLENCTNPVKGTTALISCNEFYEEATLQKNPLRVCQDGAWHPSIPECYPTCGMKTPKGKSNIVMGQNAVPGDYPWQVGIYGKQKNFLCGGSILDQHIILTAAHCFTDERGNVKPTENYLVAAGKYYRKYDDNHDKFAQYSTILKIHVPQRYKGITGFHAFDIAILILKNPFELSAAVQPVCIELNEESANLHLSLNSRGIVLGWGYTREGNTLSDVLKELTIPYVPYDKCYNEIVESFRRFVTFDKICAGYLNNATSVCGGDSGGGLVFKNTFDQRYYVKAIVSTSPATEVLQCDTNQYSLYTSIKMHMDFVRDLITINRRQHQTVCIQDGCKNEEIGKVMNCRLPNNPLHGKYVFHNSKETYKPGNLVSQFTVLFLTCDSGYEVNPAGTSVFICVSSEQWAPALGSCSEVQIQVQKAIQKVGEKSKQKCKEYGKYVFEYSNIEVPPNNNFRLNKNSCSFTDVQDSIDVKPAKEKEFPHMALIGFDGTDKTEWFYGGSLISEKYVLTAAHCIIHISFGFAKYILLGELIMNSVEDGDLTTQHILIKKTILHPGYKPPAIYNSIALLELAHDAILNAYVRPACLNTNPIPMDAIGIVSGWGQTTSFEDISPHMHRAILNIFTHAECNYTYKGDRTLPNGIDEKTQICAGARNKSNVDVCEGGAPLQIENSEVFCTYNIMGVTAFGRTCGVADIPTGYTRVSAYIEWIEGIVWK